MENIIIRTSPNSLHQSSQDKKEQMVEANPSADDGFAEFQNVGAIPDTVMNQEVKDYEAEQEDEFFIIPSGDY